jgi:hypothetical protein
MHHGVLAESVSAVMSKRPSDCAQADPGTPPGLTRTARSLSAAATSRASGVGWHRAGFLLCNRMPCEIR